MQILFRDTAKKDFLWFIKYYEDVFPEGLKNADSQLEKTFNLLKTFPQSGQPLSKNEHFREIQIPKTPFSLYYSVETDTIFILRVIDNRSARS